MPSSLDGYSNTSSQKSIKVQSTNNKHDLMDTELHLIDMSVV